jgi:hypothetical protein
MWTDELSCTSYPFSYINPSFRHADCSSCYLLHADSSLGLFCVPEDRGNTFLRNVDLQTTTRRYIPDDRTLRNHRCENLKYWDSIYFLWRSRGDLPDHFPLNTALAQYAKIWKEAVLTYFFSEIVTVCSDNHMKHKYTVWTKNRASEC